MPYISIKKRAERLAVTSGFHCPHWASLVIQGKEQSAKAGDRRDPGVIPGSG